MKTFTNCAEKKAKQFLNLLQGYTKGIRFTAILILLLMGVSNAWAGTYYYSGQGNGTNWSKKAMTVSDDGFYEYYLVSSTTTHQFKIGTASNQYAYNEEYVSTNFNGTNIANIGDYGGDNCYCWQGSKHYILVYKPNTTVNNTSKPIICAATYLPDNRECTVYFVNKDSWNSVNAYGWYYQNNTDGSNNGWPGKTMTNTGKTYNGKQIWSYTYPQTYDKAIFNDGSNQTSDLTLGTTNKGNMYDPNSQWIAYTYDVKVTFNANGHGTAPAAQTVLKGGKVSAPAAPTATGYTFGGWYKESNCANAFDFNTAINADITLYAKWTAKTYDVTLNPQSGTGGTTSVTATYGSAMPSATMPTKTGYTFGGYYTSNNGDGTQYYAANGASARNWDIAEHSTLYAKWTINSHKVAWKANGGNWGGNSADKVVTYNYGATIIEQAAPTRDGYDFRAWSPAFDANTTMPDNDLTYTAQWTANQYTITYKDKGDANFSGTHADGHPTTHTYGTATTLKGATKTGYTFGGWFDNKECTGTAIESLGATAYTDNITLYAKWTINTYTIDYGVVGEANGAIQLDGGTKVTTSSSTTANYNTSPTFTAEPNQDYKIGGWYSDANGANKIDAAGTNKTYNIASLTDDIAVYVKFVEAAEVMSQVVVGATEGGAVTPSGNVAVGNRTPTTFTATPAPGYRFDEWTYTGGIRTSGSLTNSSIDITANGTGTLTAHFVRVHTVNFYATPAIAGSVAATVGGNTITSGDKLDTGRRITFTASVANTYNGQCTFVKWVDGAGTLLSTETTYEHNLTGDITVKGIFKITQYTLTFSASEGGHVSAKANNSAIASPANLDYNTSVTLTAEPDAGCAFVKWVDGADKQLSTNATYTIDLKSNQTVKAVFNKGTTVYMKAIEYWKKDHPRYAIYYWGAGDKNGWVDMTNVDCNGDIYEGYVPAGYTNFKFVRLAPSTANEWENKWNETPDLTTTNNTGKMYIQPHVYLKPNSNWKSDGARFAAYFFKQNDDSFGKAWMGMSDIDGDGIYSCEIPTDKAYPNVIFCRMNPAFDTNDWDKDDNDYVWNQTSDLTVPSNNNNLYTVKDGTWDKGGGTWSAGPHKNGWQTYEEPSYKITYNSKPTNGTITVTKAGNNVAIGTSLDMGDEIKITFAPADGYELINYNVEYATETEEEGVYSVCGPTNITAEFAKAGTARTVYLRPNEDWLRDEPIFAAYTWNSKDDTQNHWYIMTTKADDYTGAYSCNISSTYDWVIFVRIKPAGRDGSDGSLKFENAWNQTKDLAIIDKDNDKTNDNKLRCAISNQISEGKDKDKYDVKWEENTPIWGLTANFNDWKAEKAVFKGYPGHLDVMPPFGTSHEFKLYNFVYENNKYLGNAGTMKRANSGQWWTMEATEQANCQMMLDVKGDYIYQMRFLTVGAELRKQISVTYPEADTKYALHYTDKNVSRISYDIPAVNGEQNDTISFFVDKDANPTIKLLVNTTETGDAIQVSVSESGVYNFILQQNGGAVTVIAANPEPYQGYYYIRTDAASGGWGGYKQNGNKMTYTSYADKNHNFDHYYCKWITSSESSYTNVKFCVANDYSHKLSDELDGDEIIEKADVHTGCLPENANVRFGWDSKTNELSRAYISGSSTASDRFLVLTGNEYLLDIDGTTIPTGTGDRAGLLANEDIFDDMGNWVYQLDVQANKQTAIKLTANFNNKVQTFFGDARAAEGVALVMDATSDEYYKVRMVYNFKTNHLLAAWLLDREQEINKGEITSNVLIIREDHGEANQLQFNNDLTEMTINTAYAAMTFTKDHVTDKDLNQWQRYEYWVSFPFNVKISDVFGFGEYGTDWIMQLYDGAERAANGYWIDSPTFWKYITNRNYELQAGVGYVLKLQASKMTDETAFMYSDKVSLYFPSITNDAGNTIISATPDTQHEIPEHECTIERDNRNIYDSHWNLIGVPGYANIEGLSTAANLSPVKYDNQQVSFYYAYNAADNTYQATSATSDFKNMHSYMVQFAGTINWSTPAVVSPAELAARRNSDAEPERVILRLELTQGEEVADQTFVQLQQEGATANFDLSLDLTKIINSGVSNIYTLTDSLKIQVAGNALPMEETVVPVGVNIAAAGEYTFRMPDGTEGMVVELIDYEANTTTNLLLDDYTVNLPTGSAETRFALSIKPEKTATNVGNIGGTMNDGLGVRKFIIDGKLYLQKDGMLYDAQGHIVR